MTTRYKITTGQTILLVKECVDCSLANSGGFSRKKSDNIVNSMKQELKGAFMTGTYYPVGADIRIFVNPTNVTGKQIEKFIQLKTYGAYIDWMNVRTYLNIRIDEPSIKKIYDQMEIECWRPLKEMLGEARFEANRSIVNYRKHYEYDYVNIIKKFRNDVVACWNNGLPSAEVMKVFEHIKTKTGRKICYRYKTRNRKSECNWIKGMEPAEIARKLANKGIYELPANYVRMLKEYRISVKKVNTELDNIRKSTSETCRRTRAVMARLKEIRERKPDLYSMYVQFSKGEMAETSFVHVMKAYGCDLTVNGKIYIEPDWTPVYRIRNRITLQDIYGIQQ